MAKAEKSSVAGDAYKRVKNRFDGLVGKAKDPDNALILEGLRDVATLLAALRIGQIGLLDSLQAIEMHDSEKRRGAASPRRSMPPERPS